MKIAIAILAVLFGPVTPLLADCHNVVRRQNVVVLDTGFVVTPFAVPIAVPVSYAVPNVLYSYNGQQVQPQYAQPRAAAAPQAQSKDAEWEEFLQWKASRAKAAAAPQTAIQASCVKCHSGATPKGDLDLSGELDDATRLAAIGMVVQGKMPPKIQLPGDIVGKLIGELSVKEEEPKVRASEAPQPEASPPIPNPESR